nr:MAG TPA: YopX protein [Caudoviricetes sp.]DAV41573.1 MAG TPA: YopX protein [Caudoviricetes sp.]
MLKKNGRSVVVLLRFRAWNKATKEMYEVDDIMSIDFGKSKISVKTLFFEQTNRYDFDDIVLMQSTGLTDKHGKEIFEGDIIDSTDGFLTGVIEFRVSLGMFVSDLVEYNNFERLCNIASSRKIIGNIWEHPELAEVSS